MSLLLCGIFYSAVRWFLTVVLLLLQSMGSTAHRLQELWLPGSRAQAQGCGARASLLRGTQDLPRSGIEPVSPALAGGLFTTETPRKSLTTLVLMCFDVGRTNPFCSYYSSFTIYSSTIWVCLFLTVFPTTILVFSHIRPTTWLIYGHF